MVIGNEEHKQRVNLSALARTVLETDFALFGGKTRSGFFNRIITIFAPCADASIDNAVEEYGDQLHGVLADIKDSEQKKSLMDALVDDRRRHLLLKKESYPKGESVIFRLNNENFNELYEDGRERNNYATPAKYLKALFEEYARLSPAERERVYFSEMIDILHQAIDRHDVIETVLGNTPFLIRPYAVMADSYGTHMYLVGLSRPKEDPRDENERIVSIRVSRLEGVKRRARHNLGKLTIDNKLDMEEKLRCVGVQYLVGEAENITLKLTPHGQREFLQRAHMRPQPTAVTQDGVYTFYCTPRQIKNFFISFGKDVEILAPLSLREEFVETYREALCAYEG